MEHLDIRARSMGSWAFDAMVKGILRKFAHSVFSVRPEKSAPFYDAFLSYHTENDGELCRALRSRLVHFAKPLWRLRAIRVFRDTESGLGSPDIRKGLRRAIRASRYLILMANPESARSPYVAWELDQWIQDLVERGHSPADFLLLIQTGGRIVRDPQDQSIDWEQTDALPRELKHPWKEPAPEAKSDRPVLNLSEVLTGSLRVENLSWARGVSARQSRAKDFEAVIASLSSIIRKIPREDLLSEEIRRRRQTLRIAIGTIVVLAGLVATATWSWRAAIHARVETERRYAAAVIGHGAALSLSADPRALDELISGRDILRRSGESTMVADMALWGKRPLALRSSWDLAP